MPSDEKMGKDGKDRVDQAILWGKKNIWCGFTSADLILKKGENKISENWISQ